MRGDQGKAPKNDGLTLLGKQRTSQHGCMEWLAADDACRDDCLGRLRSGARLQGSPRSCCGHGSRATASAVGGGGSSPASRRHGLDRRRLVLAGSLDMAARALGLSAPAGCSLGARTLVASGRALVLAPRAMALMHPIALCLVDTLALLVAVALAIVSGARALAVFLAIRLSAKRSVSRGNHPHCAE